MEQSNNKTKFSPFQEAIFKHIIEGDSNLMVKAVAGSGKTTTIINALKLIPSSSSVIYLAFNKKIVEEIKKKVPSNVLVKTLHSEGYSQLLASKISKKPKVEEEKISLILKKLKETSWKYLFGGDKKLINEYCYKIKSFVNLCRLDLCVTDEDFIKLAEKHGELLSNMEIVHIREVIKISKSDKQVYDFVDMIYMPVVCNEIKNYKTYDWIFIDECQDLNKAQIELMKKILKKNGRFVAVGDPNQAIYGFAGADLDSFNILANQPNTTILPLSVCYRCGTKIIELAKKIVPEIEPFDLSDSGEVIYDFADLSSIKSGDWILCRNYRPLAVMCLQLIAKGIKANIVGIDFGKNLIRMLESTGENDIAKAIVAINIKLAKLITKLKNQDLNGKEIRNHNSVIMLKEKIQVIRCLSANCKNVKEVCKKILSIFKDNPEDSIMLSTIHKSKGLESDRVYIIRPDLMPSRYAIEDWQIKQEYNLMYVAYTRAKKTLAFIPESVWTDDSKNNFVDKEEDEEENDEDEKSSIKQNNSIKIRKERKTVKI